jgi:hypothetical protein
VAQFLPNHAQTFLGTGSRGPSGCRTFCQKWTCFEQTYDTKPSFACPTRFPQFIFHVSYHITKDDSKY